MKTKKYPKFTSSPTASGSSDDSWRPPSWTNNALVVLLIGLVITGWINLSGKVQDLEVKVGKIEQAIADGGVHAIISKIDKASSPQDVTNGMNLVISKVELANAKIGKLSNEQVADLTPPLVESVKQFPEVPTTWSAIAKLASYRSEVLQPYPQIESKPLPDCDSQSAQTQILDQSQIPQIPLPPGLANVRAYLFRDCVLHLDRLPGKRKEVMATETGHESDTAPRNMVIGSPAFAINCIIELDDAGISDTDIIWLETSNCRLVSTVTALPLPREQRFLLAALQSPTPDKTSYPVGPMS